MIQNLSMIACVSADLGLGLDNHLLWNIPEDMQFFRATTSGHPVVMGSRTYESIGRPLPKRENIILSRQEPAVPDGVKVFHDLAQLKDYLRSLPGEKFIIGGATLYQLFLNEATTLYLTEVAATQPADTFFPKFDPAQYHREVLQSGEITPTAQPQPAAGGHFASGDKAQSGEITPTAQPQPAIGSHSAPGNEARSSEIDKIHYDVVKYTYGT